MILIDPEKQACGDIRFIFHYNGKNFYITSHVNSNGFLILCCTCRK